MDTGDVPAATGAPMAVSAPVAWLTSQVDCVAWLMLLATNRPLASAAIDGTLPPSGRLELTGPRVPWAVLAQWTATLPFAALARLLLSPPQAASAIKLLSARAQGAMREGVNILEGVMAALWFGCWVSKPCTVDARW